jgi:hypothetical protein
MQPKPLHLWAVYIGSLSTNQFHMSVNTQQQVWHTDVMWIEQAIAHDLYQAWATFPSLGAKLSFCLRVKGRTKLLNKIN